MRLLWRSEWEESRLIGDFRVCPFRGDPGGFGKVMCYHS